MDRTEDGHGSRGAAKESCRTINAIILYRYGMSRITWWRCWTLALVANRRRN